MSIFLLCSRAKRSPRRLSVPSAKPRLTGSPNQAIPRFLASPQRQPPSFHLTESLEVKPVLREGEQTIAPTIRFSVRYLRLQKTWRCTLTPFDFKQRSSAPRRKPGRIQTPCSSAARGTADRSCCLLQKQDPLITWLAGPFLQWEVLSFLQSVSSPGVGGCFLTQKPQFKTGCERELGSWPLHVSSAHALCPLAALALLSNTSQTSQVYLMPA